MNNTSVFPQRQCSQCGRNLIFVEEITEVVENHFAPITTKIYRCEDDACQADKDKKTAARIKLQSEKDADVKKRADVRAEERLNKKKLQ